MTARSIAPDSSQAYAQYLDGKASPPARGDYYLGRDGLPTEAPGRWHASPATLERLGVDPSEPVGRLALEALMQGRDPRSSPEAPQWLRPAGANGQRAAGIDVTFSAPKSVSVVWALAQPETRAAIERAHGRAVEGTLFYLAQTVPMVAQYRGPGIAPAEVLASGVIAAEFVHTTARGVSGGVPDPQLHSHVVITAAVRADGSVAAVRSRPVFQSAREVGAYYRAQLAWELEQLGFAVQGGTGKDGRYFELADIDQPAREAFSKRAIEVREAADEFRARTGRAPEREELRAMKLATRQAKTPTTRAELARAWQQTAVDAGLGGPPQQRHGPRRPPTAADRTGWAQDVEAGLVRDRATFTERELRATGLEQAPGRLPADEAVQATRDLERAGTVLRLQEGHLTTARVRAMEGDVERRVAAMASQRDVLIGGRHREVAASLVAERLGGSMSPEQLQALEVLAGPERAAVLIGPAGTGKGVVIDAVARAELLAGRQVLGTAVAGATAERLGRDSPALEGRTRTIDSLLAAVSSGGLRLDARSTVVLDEAGMADTERLQRLVACVEVAQAKLLLVGDSRQLASIGPGGLLDRLTERSPSVQLEEVRRTRSPAEQEAWRALRAGQPEPALAHYRARGQLHLADSREQAMEAAVRRYDELSARHGSTEVALMTDGSNLEIDLMNLRVQQLRRARGELGPELPQADPDRPALHAGDRVTWTAAQRVPGQPRVENGTRGTLEAVAGDTAQIRVDATGRVVDVGPGEHAALRLAYAQHLYRQQGATVQRAVTVTGGWQTTREGAYVQASRARKGIDWHMGRDQLGQEGTDLDRVYRLAELMRTSGAQIPSTHFALGGEPIVGRPMPSALPGPPGLGDPTSPVPAAPALPGVDLP